MTDHAEAFVETHVTRIGPGLYRWLVGFRNAEGYLEAVEGQSDEPMDDEALMEAMSETCGQALGLCLIRAGLLPGEFDGKQAG